MRIASLGSGSKGNATLVDTGETLLLIDCGLPRRDVEARLQSRGVSGRDIDAILVTHEHGDHCRGVVPLAKAYNLPVFLTACLLYTSPSPRDRTRSRMPSSA